MKANARTRTNIPTHAPKRIEQKENREEQDTHRERDRYIYAHEKEVCPRMNHYYSNNKEETYAPSELPMNDFLTH